MSVSQRQIEQTLPAEYEIKPLSSEDGDFIVLDEQGGKAKIQVGTEDGNDYVQIDEWDETSERIFVGQERDTQTFFDYEWVEELFSERETNYEARATTAMETGYEEAYKQTDKKRQAETLIEAAESAFEFLSEGGLDVDGYVLNSSDGSQTLGSGRLKFNGINSEEFDFTKFADPEWSTAAAYISSLILLQESDQKPSISTGYGYKPGHENRSTADIDLVQQAQELTDEEYDFFN